MIPTSWELHHYRSPCPALAAVLFTGFRDALVKVFFSCSSFSIDHIFLYMYKYRFCPTRNSVPIRWAGCRSALTEQVDTRRIPRIRCTSPAPVSSTHFFKERSQPKETHWPSFRGEVIFVLFVLLRFLFLWFVLLLHRLFIELLPSFIFLLLLVFLLLIFIKVRTVEKVETFKCCLDFLSETSGSRKRNLWENKCEG